LPAGLRAKLFTASRGPGSARRRRQRNASGNVKLKDIDPLLREKVEAFFKAEGIPIIVRYFDPSYQVRSRRANCEEALLCDLFARHAAMAGKTGVVIGFLHERFIHVPIAAHSQ
jgi:6-phosphofructokinase 1